MKIKCKNKFQAIQINQLSHEIHRGGVRINQKDENLIKNIFLDVFHKLYF